MRMRFLWAATLMMLLIGADRAAAQNASVTGTVTDPSGGVMPGAVVTAHNQETGLSRSATTADNGQYRVPALPPGSYLVTAELSGFTTEQVEDLVLVIDQTATINFSMKPAAVAETITVASDAALIDTTASTVSTSVSNRQIQDLPVASRRWIDLAMLTPGTSQDNIRGFFYRGNVNLGGGAREYSNGFVVDGVNNTWAQMGEPRQNFAMDAIREFKVSTSNYKAEYGLATGGLLTVVSKSGTNQWHGSGLLFVRDQALTARSYFEGVKPDFRRFQYGGTLGGPVVRNRTHFFAAYEGTDEDVFYTIATLGVWPEYDGTYASAQNRWTYSTKVDHQLTPTQTLFVRYGQENEYRPIVTAGGRTHPSNSFDFAVPRSSAVAGHTWVLGPRALNDFRFQYAYSKFEVSPPNTHGSWEPGDFGADRLSHCTPVFFYPTITVGGCGNSQMGPEARVELKNDFSYLMNKWGGSHQWKMGVDYSHVTFSSDNLNSPLGQWTFPRDVPYDANDRSTWPTSYVNTLPTYADIPVTHFSAYVQDDWQIGRGLTLNLGLRYDVQFGSFNEDIADLQSRIADKLGPGFGYPLPIPFLEGSDRRGDRNNFGPRAGFAWDPWQNGRTNIHAAYGMFYDNMRTLQNFDELTWPQGKTIVIPNPIFPDPLQGRTRDDFISTAPPNIVVFDNDTVNPYAHQVNAGVTHMVTNELALTADVTTVFRYSDRNSIDPNLPDPPRTATRPNYPQFNRVVFGQPTADNSYKALLVKVEKRMSKRHQYLVSYTLTNADDTNFSNRYGDVYGFVRDTLPAVADRRHRLVASGIVQGPLDTQLSLILDLRSSLPFAPSTSLDLNGDGYTNDLPAGVLRGSGCRTLDLDAVNAFRASRSLAAVGEPACPGFSNLDLRVSKFFTVMPGHRLELIAQLFNAFDRANFNVPAGNLAGATFGQVNSLLPNINAPSRQVEFAVRYQF
jgi:Carboxypeptidase regulatory-like domain/TonB-dependent Receptor Plug Domain/TonB dependent receptor